MWRKPNWLAQMSLFEKIFWMTLLLLFLLYLILIFLANNEAVQKPPTKNISQNQTVEKPLKGLYREIEIIINSDKFRQNLETNLTIQLLHQNLNKTLTEMNQTIEIETERLFSVVVERVDPFLDFHYSIIGEYTELGAMAAGKIEKTIKDKIFGEVFETEMGKTLLTLSQQEQKAMKEHFKFIDRSANQDIDETLNTKVVERLREDLNQNITLQTGKFGTLATLSLAPKIIQAVAAKLAAKQASAIATKVGVKMSMKSAAAASGAAGGVICGPFVWVCSPVAAAALWFGTDAVVLSADEHFNRDDFKAEIINALNTQKRELQNQLRNHYTKTLQSFSTKTQNTYKETPTKERKKIRELMSQ